MLQTLTIFGPPGTGKTTTLLGMVEKELKICRPNQVGFVSFTRKAVAEARDRASTELGLCVKDLTYFRTLHALAFYWLGLKRTGMLSGQDYQTFGESLGIEISGKLDIDLYVREHRSGDQALALDTLARVTGRSLREVWAETDCDLDWYEVEQVALALRQYKHITGLRDYTDLLEEFLTGSEVPQLKVLFVDEAQDLNPLQWRVVRRLAAEAERLVVAGDDDQAIYGWAGASVRELLNLPGEKRILEKSYRLPQTIYQEARRLSKDIAIRQDKDFQPADRIGRVEHLATLDELNLESGNWYVLARNNYLLKRVVEHCRYHGYYYTSKFDDPGRYPELLAARYYERLRAGEQISTEQLGSISRYILNRPKKLIARLTDRREKIDPGEDLGLQRPYPIWHELLTGIDPETREFIISLLRRKEKLTVPPRLTISTIHGVKGGERDNVAILSDVSGQSYRNFIADPDAETRVFYTGITRARENLFILQPTNQYYFNL